MGRSVMGKMPRTRIDRQYDEDFASAEAAPSEYREGFITGYLRAYLDRGEYACSIRSATIAYGLYLREGGHDLPRQDVDGC